MADNRMDAADRGLAADPMRRGPLFGYLVATLIFGAVVYFLQFQARDDNIVNCEKRNDQIREVNKRAPTIRKLIRVEIIEVNDKKEPMSPKSARAHKALIGSSIQKVPLNDCSDLFDRPFPFG